MFYVGFLYQKLILSKLCGLNICYDLLGFAVVVKPSDPLFLVKVVIRWCCWGYAVLFNLPIGFIVLPIPVNLV